MKRFKRIFVIVMDSVGAGAMPDAADFGDAGADTLGHIAERVPELEIPHLVALGLANLHRLGAIAPVQRPRAAYTKLREQSRGKDTMTGHWEMMGVLTTKPFITFTEQGFPHELIRELEKRTGHQVIGNISASGTEIIERFGEEEIATGHMIVYTSADSVMQICGNEETFGLDELYRCCEIARELTMREEWRVGRVIARPYVGRRRGEFKRTSNRRDYALKPPFNVLNALQDGGIPVTAIGKIHDIFDGEGISRSLHSDSSVQGMEQTLDAVRSVAAGLVFVNLVDFDALWGHRRDPAGYARELEKFDVKLGELLALLGSEDLLMITADHGNDPTFRGTDHTREKAPFLAWTPGMSGGALPEQETFGVIGATVADNFGVMLPPELIGTSILERILKF